MNDDRSPASALAALEALFDPSKKKETPSGRVRAAKMIAPRVADEGPRDAERDRLIARLRSAEGRVSITRCADELLGAGFAFGDDQDVHLALLQHSREDAVRTAIDNLARVLVEQPPQRRAVLDARLRSLEECAEEDETRTKAAALRRRLHAASIRLVP